MMQGLRDEMMACSPCPPSISDPPTTPTTPTTHPHHHHHLPSSPTVASSPPLTAQPPASTLTSLCNMASETASLHPTEGSSSTSTTSSLSCHLPMHSDKPPLSPDKQAALAADKQAALSSKLRLARSLASSSSMPSPSSFSSFRASLMDDANNSSSSAFSPPYSALLSSKQVISSFSRQNSDMDVSHSGRSSADGGSKCGMEAVDTDIHVMSPSLVNSQVLSKTRPLSPLPGDMNSRSGPDSSRPIAQSIAFQTHEFQRTPKYDVMSMVARNVGSDVRETLADVCGATSGMGHPPSPRLDAHHLDRSLSNSSNDRSGWERRSTPQRSSWSRRRRPSSANLAVQEKESLQGSVREMLDSNESMTSLHNVDVEQPHNTPAAEEPKTGSRGRGGR
ncbi:hypothetical protein FHG87_007226 [Trinorchestia longiramus]|nr:hypothetical protein FHG87_007226 [Trinorchestia longiramus]